MQTTILSDYRLTLAKITQDVIDLATQDSPSINNISTVITSS